MFSLKIPNFKFLLIKLFLLITMDGIINNNGLNLRYKHYNLYLLGGVIG